MEKGANLRTAPSNSVEPFQNLRFGVVLDELSLSATKWKHVRVLDGQHSNKSGYVSANNLSVIHSEGAARLVKSAQSHWDDFDRGRGNEMDDGSSTAPQGNNYKQKVLDMWDALRGGRPPNNDTSHPNWPWSGAGMSAFVRKAGGYDNFRYSSGHHAFIKHSVRQREEGEASGPFWGYRLLEHKPLIGDLVVRWRGGVKTYEQVRAIMETSTTFFSHTDVVCEIRSGDLWALGANNSGSVSRVRYVLDTNGFVKLTGDRFMIMKNMLP